MLVGDLIMSVREALTDLPQTLAPPVLYQTGVPPPPLGGYFPPQTYYIVATAVTPWGESLPSNEIQVTVLANSNINVGVAQEYGFLATTLQSYNIYIGEAPGAEIGVQNFPISGSSVYTLTGPTDSIAPPQRSSAYLPDTNGSAVSAYTMFRWINDALKLASQICGGLPDYGGVGTIAGSPQYIAPGLWKRISSMWYDGYPLAMDDNGNYFRRNAITASVLSSVASSTFNNQMMIELWPQPARTAAQTTLASPMLSTDTIAELYSTAGFLLTNGFALIGSEIVSYSGLTGNLNNLQRALGGSSASVWPAGTQVNELNLFWSGWRMYSPAFVPGNSMLVVPVPVGWESILFEYGIGRMKLAEQNVGDYSKLTDSFKKQLSDWYRTNKVTTGPRQVGDVSQGLEVLENLGGGWVIP